jgi:hypothetical protein
MSPQGKKDNWRRGRFVLAVATVVALVLTSPMVAQAATTVTELPFEVLMKVGGQRSGSGFTGSESCVASWVIRFHEVPGTETYTVKFHDDETMFTSTGPASKFPGAYPDPPYAPEDAAWDAPPGYLEVAPAGGKEIIDSEANNGKPIAWQCIEDQKETEEAENPYPVTVTATTTAWVISGTTFQKEGGTCGCETAPAPGVKLTLEGKAKNEEEVAMTATSEEHGHWELTVPEGVYTVIPKESGWEPSERKVVVNTNVGGVNFTHGDYTLSGKVLGGEGEGVAGVTVLFQETVNKALQVTRTTTDAEGRFSEKLPPGTATVSAQTSNGTEFFPEPSADCQPQNVSCVVTLNKNRSVTFTSCVIPNPNGEALPANTPNPIPGAKTAGQLEAVGCWTPQNGSGGGEPTIFHSSKPVRLDGIDVEPLPGTTLQLDTSGPTVTSSGPAKVLVDGWPIIGGVVPPTDISLNYQGGSQLSVSDQGAATGPAGLGANFFGLPISLGTGTSLGYGLPFGESVGPAETGGGQTAINGGIQIPLNTHATWDAAAGVFKEATPSEVFSGGSILEEKATVPSIGLGGSIILTNRLGLTGKICLSLNDLSTEFLFPFPRNGWDDGEISGAQVCYLAAQGSWEGTGMFKLPSALAKAVGDIFVKLTAQKAKPTEGGRFFGYKVQNFGLQFEHLRTETFQYPELGEVRSSGMPLGEGFFLQSLGGEFSNDVNTGKVSEIKGTMGISFGPEVNVELGKDLKGTELSLLRGDLEFALLPSGPEISYWTYRLAGALTFARLSPAELQLASAKVVFHANPTNPETDFSGQLGGSVLGTGAALNVSGQAQGSNFLMEGTGTVKAFGHYGTLDAILNNYLLGVCLTADGKPLVGFNENLADLEEPATWGCNLGAFKHPNGASSATVHRVERLRMGRGLAASVLAVRGTTAAPRVRLSGPDVSITATPTVQPRGEDGAIVFDDPARHITYIGLLHPQAGVWTVSALPGSPAIAEVLQAQPGPSPRIRTHVARHGCSDELRYHVLSTDGDRIAVYAQQGEGHVYVGELHAGSGTLKLGLLPQIKGRGKLIAYYLRANQPQGSTTLTTFANAASNGSEKPTHLALHASTLKWQTACAAATYSVKITRSGRISSETTTKPTLKLPAGHGSAKVTVTAFTSGGQKLGSERGTLR